MRVKVEPKSYQTLDRLSRPSNPDQPEGLHWVVFDSQSFTSASTTTLTFFQTLQTNKSLGNLDAAGQFTRGQYFECWYMGLDILDGTVSSIAASDAGSLRDVSFLLFGDAGDGSDSGRFTFSMLNKVIGPFPLSFLHASGGPTGFGFGTQTAPLNIQYANNGIFDHGFDMGKLIIPPNTTFSVVLDWGGTVALTTSPVGLRVWLEGVIYRPIR